MQITAGELRRIIREAHWRVLGGKFQDETGNFYNAQVDLEADSEEEAISFAKNSFSNADFEPDVISAEEIGASKRKVRWNSPVLLDMGVNIPNTDKFRRMASEAFYHFTNAIEESGWEVTDGWEDNIEEFVGRMGGWLMYSPTHWKYSETPHSSYAVEAYGLGSHRWLNPISAQAKQLVDKAIELLIEDEAGYADYNDTRYSYWGPTPKDYHEQFGNLKHGYVISATNIYEAWLSLGHSDDEAGRIGRGILRIAP